MGNSRVTRKKCPKCGSFDLKKNGKNQSDSQKLKCKKCLFCFVERSKRKQEREFQTNTYFEKYITEGYSIRQLSDQKDIPAHRIRRDIQHRLDINEIHCIDEVFPDVHYIMIDGYGLPKMKDENGHPINRVLLLYYDSTHGKVIWFSIRDGERKEYIRPVPKYYIHNERGDFLLFFWFPCSCCSERRVSLWESAFFHL